jgi:autotransporter passenger strand-loop-strand repeat protein
MGAIVTSANSPYYVSGGQIDTGDIVDGGGSMYVLAGGIAQSTTVNAGGVEYVTTNGTDTDATLSGGEENVAGLASNATVDNGGEQVVAASGTATGTMINADGYQDVYGIADNTTIGNGGEQVVFDSGTVNNTTISGGGTEYVASGGHAQNVTFTGQAALDLESPSGLVGTITDWQVGDLLDFVNTFVASASISGSTLTVTTSGGGTSSYQLSGQQSNTSPILQSDGSGGTELELQPVNPTVPANTTEVMILRDGNNGDYAIYDIGSNAIVAAYLLGQVGLAWQIAGLGGFDGTDTIDMILRDANNGAFEVYDTSNNTITSAASLGDIGLEWTVSGFGDFSGRAGETDMLMRATSGSNIGAFRCTTSATTPSPRPPPSAQSGWSGRLPGSGLLAAIPARATC